MKTRVLAALVVAALSLPCAAIAADSPAFGLGGAMAWDSMPAPVAAAVPEPASWAMMILGFGGIGALMRRRRTFARAV